ncbi:LPXTG cell wall anchor domain-containing protein [Streptococcus anginosus]|uniref:LPXTG cell wall anchor domain-containing protein n=2 Tax=Streptococcus anginosus TaxID=1328 RepID=UPI001300107E|nr:LPXTG cell wall anchor domain-containing protein [Streptococcus anginosus]
MKAFTKQLTSATAITLAAASGIGVVHADEVSTPAPKTEVKETKTVITNEQVEAAKAEKEASAKAAVEAETPVADAKQDVAKAESEKATADNNVAKEEAHVNEVAKESGTEDVQKALVAEQEAKAQQAAAEQAQAKKAAELEAAKATEAAKKTEVEKKTAELKQAAADAKAHPKTITKTVDPSKDPNYNSVNVEDYRKAETPKADADTIRDIQPAEGSTDINVKLNKDQAKELKESGAVKSYTPNVQNVQRLVTEYINKARQINGNTIQAEQNNNLNATASLRAKENADRNLLTHKSNLKPTDYFKGGVQAPQWLIDWYKAHQNDPTADPTDALYDEVETEFRGKKVKYKKLNKERQEELQKLGALWQGNEIAYNFDITTGTTGDLKFGEFSDHMNMSSDEEMAYHIVQTFLADAGTTNKPMGHAKTLLGSNDLAGIGISLKAEKLPNGHTIYHVYMIGRFTDSHANQKNYVFPKTFTNIDGFNELHLPNDFSDASKGYRQEKAKMLPKANITYSYDEEIVDNTAQEALDAYKTSSAKELQTLAESVATAQVAKDQADQELTKANNRVAITSANLAAAKAKAGDAANRLKLAQDKLDLAKVAQKQAEQKLATAKATLKEKEANLATAREKAAKAEKDYLSLANAKAKQDLQDKYNDIVARGNLPVPVLKDGVVVDYTEAKVPNDAPINDKPEYKPSQADLLEAKKIVIEERGHKAVPVYKDGVLVDYNEAAIPSDAPINDKPEYKPEPEKPKDDNKPSNPNKPSDKPKDEPKKPEENKPSEKPKDDKPSNPSKPSNKPKNEPKKPEENKPSEQPKAEKNQVPQPKATETKISAPSVKQEPVPVVYAKDTKETLPQTGEHSSLSMAVLGGMLALTGLGVAGTKRKREK